jgi:hypothetical protein
MNDHTLPNEIGSGHSPLPGETPHEELPAWVMIENGRYQPQRIKGSCLGRELG